jgi:hypothetical protein
MFQHLLKTVFILFISIITTKGQTFYKTFNETFRECIETSDSTIACTGSKFEIFDNSGNSIHSLGFQHEFETISITPYNEFILGGVFLFNMSGSGHNGRIIKTDSTGSVIWIRSITDSTGAEGDITDSKIDKYGNYNFLWSLLYSRDISLLRTDSSGIILWDSVYALPDDQYITSMELDPNNNIYVAGIYSLTAGYEYGFVAKFNYSGNLLNYRVINYPYGYESEFFDLVYVNDSVIFAYGDMRDQTSQFSRPFIVKFNSSLDSISSAVVNEQSKGRSMVVDTITNQIYLLSDGPVQYDSTEKIFIFKTDYNFSSLSERIIDSLNVEDNGYDIQLLRNGNLLVSGYLREIYSGFLTSIDTTGFSPVTFSTKTGELNYENEFSVTVINKIFKYDSENIILKCSVYSALGNKIIEFTPFNRTGSISLSDLKQGIYLISLQTKKNQKTFKVIIN